MPRATVQSIVRFCRTDRSEKAMQAGAVACRSEKRRLFVARSFDPEHVFWRIRLFVHLLFERRRDHRILLAVGQQKRRIDASEMPARWKLTRDNELNAGQEPKHPPRYGGD